MLYFISIMRCVIELLKWKLRKWKLRNGIYLWTDSFITRISDKRLIQKCLNNK